MASQPATSTNLSEVAPSKTGPDHSIPQNCMGEPSNLPTHALHDGEAITASLEVPDQATVLGERGDRFHDQYVQFGNLDDIDSAIEYYGQAVSFTPDGRSDKPKLNENLGASYLSRFRGHGQLADLDMAIKCNHQAVSLTPDGDPCKSTRLSNLGVLHNRRFECLEERSDLDLAIDYQSEAVLLAPEEHSEKPSWLSNLAVSHLTRFEHFKEPADLGRAIDYADQAVLLTQEGEIEAPKRLCNLATSYQEWFKHRGELADSDRAIRYLTEALFLTAGEDPLRQIRLNNIGVVYAERFQRTRVLADLNEAIKYSSQAISLAPAGADPSKAELLISLGELYRARYDHQHDLADLNMLIQYLAEAVASIPEHYPRATGLLNTLCSYYERRYKLQGQQGDLDMAIEHINQAISMMDRTDKNKAEFLAHLGVLYHTRFSQPRKEEGLIGSANLEDLHMAIDRKHQAIELTPDEDPNKHCWLNSLHFSYKARFKWLKQPEDLERAIKCGEQAVSLTPEGNSWEHVQFSNLGLSYQNRFELQGGSDDLDKAIEYHKKAVSSASALHKNPAMSLNNLGTSYSLRFKRLGERGDLNTAIAYHLQTLPLTPQNHPDRAAWLNNLGSCYTTRFNSFGQLADLDESIKYLGQAVSIPGEADQDKCAWLNNLGEAHRTRYEHLKNLADLDLAIRYQTQALSITPDHHLFRPRFLYSLSISYERRFGQLAKLMDIHLAINNASQAVTSTTENDVDKPRYLNGLGIAHYARFSQIDEQKDLDIAVECVRQAYELVPDEDPDKKIWCSNLGSLYRERFERLQEPVDLSHAINYHTQAVSSMLEEHPVLPRALEELSKAYYFQYETLRDPNILNQAIDCAKRAAQSAVGDPFVRFRAARWWAEISIQYDPAGSLEAFQRAIEYIPQIVWLGDATEHRYKGVASLDNITMEAAAAAVTLHKLDVALEWLEEGRTIVWSQLLQLQTHFNQLPAGQERLATELRQTAEALASRTFRAAPVPQLSRDQFSLEQENQRQHRLAEKWDSLVKQARLLPGMKDFLRSKKASSLVAAASTGAVVFVNIHEQLCYSLIISTSNSTRDKISSLGYPSSTYHKVVDARARMAFSLRGRSRAVVYEPEVHITIEETLKMLWVDIVKPVLDLLGYTDVKRGRGLPHITWCTTGPLSFLPLHAAGDYSVANCSLFDYAVSSYTPTLSALLVPPATRTECPHILAIGQAHTPGCRPLPGTVLEIDQICTTIGDTQATRLEGDRATAEAVLSGLETHSWVHFACHASQNAAKPTASAFQLHDGPLDLETITKKQLKHADLAFLSACQTATGDENLPEEVVHLAAGMIMAGFRRVVATMWSIDDEDAPLVAEKFYAYMLDEGIPDEAKAARALHHAVSCLRDRIGVSNLGRWAPYVHIGL
ncbi:hypothetical protein FRC06_001187 [Ceratobasidium sp. 370]|nr:hypothetical protein FRC06_001187 [Ceratobasidium sp. 370]